MLELIFSPKYDRSRTYWTALYNQIDSDLDNHDYQTMAFSMTHLLARNLRLVGEYLYDVNNKQSKLVVGFVSGF